MVTLLVITGLIITRFFLKAGRYGSWRYKFYWKICDMKIAIQQWLLIKTAGIRIRLSKKVIVTTPHLFDGSITWEDLYINDRWGFWLPMNTTIQSRLAWESDNEINKRIGEPEEPWQDVRICDCKDNCGYRNYYYKGDYLTLENFVDAVRKELVLHGGERGKAKDIELRINAVSQQWLDDQAQQYIDWVAKGSPAFKVEMADQAKKDIEQISSKYPKAAAAIKAAISNLKQRGPF